VLKVFLIDRRGDIREIYSSNFLHPQSVLNDIETLAAGGRGDQVAALSGSFILRPCPAGSRASCETSCLD